MDNDMQQQNNAQQRNNKKTSLMIVGIAVLVLGLVGITYAFFNYIRTGSANTIKVGRISFSSNQTETIKSLASSFDYVIVDMSIKNISNYQIFTIPNFKRIKKSTAVTSIKQPTKQKHQNCLLQKKITMNLTNSASFSKKILTIIISSRV